ncbi:MAG: METTL5 family protein [Thermogladius sp.]
MKSTSSRGSLDKKGLEIALSQLPRYPHPRRELEQYETSPDVAAAVLWDAYMMGDIEDSVVLELGCGTGRFVFGALMLGARLGICLDIDEGVLEYAREVHCRHSRQLCRRVVYMVADALYNPVVSVDTVLMNPPFGVYESNRGLDMGFLSSALDVASSVYSIHKYTEKAVELVRAHAAEKGFGVVKIGFLELKIPMMFETHRRRVHRFKAFYVVLRRGLG